ncbi:MAG: succinylglutamate desuccinylase/aspartoacylase family protein [Limnobacter sp.]|nr:succinylglutamate desuccinylase/aspartoacylase family protein [Limnobacter sp.]
MTFPELPALPVSLQFEQVTFTALNPGRKLIVLGAVHGNEVSGSKAILKMIQEFRAGTRTLDKGQVTFVPITNPLAYNRKQRNGDRNLNRNLAETDQPQDFEDHVANWLCPVLRAHDVLLDLHTFAKGDRPFALFGPPNNQGQLEPFEQQELERGLALRLGVDRFVDGWLDTYARGVQARVEYARKTGLPTEGLNTDPRYGMGTTECMRNGGGCAVTLECGQHDDPDGPAVAYQAIENTLLYLELVEGKAVEPVKEYEHLTLTEVIDKQHVDDQFSQNWLSFNEVQKDELIGVRHSGEEVRAPFKAKIVFPNPGSQAGQEWFYLARIN